MSRPTLLGHLAHFGSLWAQSELLCTQGLAYVLRTYPEARAAMAAEVKKRTGVTLDEGVRWFAEALQDDRGRPDLEGRTADDVPAVKIEAKLGADLGAGQLQSYANDLRRRDRAGALLVLVPTRRTAEASSVTAASLGLAGTGPWPTSAGHSPGVAVISWDDVFDLLRTDAPERCAHELEQLQAMYRVLNGDYIAPLADAKELRAWRERETDFHNLVDQVTRRLTTQHQTYPFGVEPLGGDAVDLEPLGYRRRYVCRSYQGGESCFCIGVRDSFAEWITPIWMCFHKRTGSFTLIRQRLEPSKIRFLDSNGHIWIPLDVPLGKSGRSMVEALVAQAEEVLRVVYREE